MEELGIRINNETGNKRRDFLKWATGILTLLCGMIVGMPLIGSFIGPAFRITKTSWIKVADVGTLPLGAPVNLRALAMQKDAYIQESVLLHVWAFKSSSTEIVVFSPICPHLGCHYNWNPASGHFECPCHGSVFAPDGKVLGGPAPRRLDTLPARVENGALYVEWKQFKSGIREKIPV